MKGEAVPAKDHVARYFGESKLNPNGTVSGTAFRLRAGKDRTLSVNWLEFLEANDRDRQIAALRDAFRTKGRDLAARAHFAVLNVGDLCAHVREKSGDKRLLRVEHDPAVKENEGYDDPSHAGVSGYSPDDDVIADLIAQVVSKIYPAKS